MTDPTEPIFINRSEREPSLNDTTIAIKNDRVRAQLEAKLQEYRHRYADYAELSAIQRVEQLGVGQYNAIFREQILNAVLAISLDEQRNFTANPIVITDIALAVQDETRLPVLSAATVPFAYDHDALTYAPDPSRIPDDPMISSFLNAYMVIKTYASGHSFGVHGGTGLPVLPIAPEQA